MPAAPSRVAAARPRPSAAPSAGERRRARLRLVDPGVLARRAARRRARVLTGLAACVVTCALLIVAAANSVVVSQQIRLDNVRAQVASALTQDQNLQLQKAVLESPSRILYIAERRLGMVAPPGVTYLTPAAPTGGAASAAHKASGTGAAPANGASRGR